MGVRSHPLQSKQEGGAQGDQIRFSFPKGNGAAGLAPQQLDFIHHPLGKGSNGLIVKVDVGEGGKQPVRQKPVGVAGAPSGGDGSLSQINQPADQFILEMGSVRLFAANAGADTSFVAGSLLALVAKHIGHENSSQVIYL